MTVALRKRRPSALGALLEITIVMVMGVAAIGAYRGWFNPSSPNPHPFHGPDARATRPLLD